MDSNISDDSATLDIIRRTAISRRGGVRVRGGRLPPIRIRDVVPTTNKKVIAPKIPQRRVRTEQEKPGPSITPSAVFKDESKDSRKSFGRGRGQRVYIQTEGSFLEQGPAMRLKKETAEPRYERISKSFSKKKSFMENKVNSSQINLLLEGYDENNEFSDYENDMQPVRFPYVKMERKTKIEEDAQENEDGKLKIKEEILENEDDKPKIKQEILDDEDGKPKIKEEILDNQEVVVKIKKEPEDDSGETKDNCILPEIKVPKQEMPEFKFCSKMETMKLLQKENAFILFQLPSCAPFKRYTENSDLKIKKEPNSTEHAEKTEKSQDEAQALSFKDMPEGFVGKLRIMKSGRMCLALGSVDFAIESALNKGSMAEVVSIPLRNKDGGDFTVIGKICEKMVMYPILKDLTKDIKTLRTSA